MGKRQMKESGSWLKVLAGAGVSMIVYLVGVLLLALLLIKGVLVADTENALLTIWVCISASCGGLLAVRAKGGARLLSVLQSVVFVGFILAGSYLFWEGPVWDRHAAALLVSALLGGCFPALLCRGGKKGKRQHRW